MSGLDLSPAKARRALRFALGLALAMWVSQVATWDLAFLAPLLTMMILATPLPRPGLRLGLGFVLALLLPMLGGMLLLPFLEYARWAGVLMVALALFYSFYFTASGGSPVLGTFITVALTITVTIGSVSVDALVLVVQALTINAAIAMLFVWLAHFLLPDLPAESSPAAQVDAPSKPPAHEARRNAFRAFCIVFPLALVFLFSSASAGYTVIMIKVAAMGQQATADKSRAMGRSLLLSTLWGGLGAIIGWNVMSIWPSLTIYVLLIALAGLLFGRQIFQVSKTPDQASMWSYALLTLIVILAPAVTDSQLTDGVGFWSRLFLFVVIAVYGNVAVAIFDAFWPSRRVGRGQPKTAASAA